ncbi:HTH-type transcriptional repressor YtrA [Thermacetogenium phaeum DSM 12270]|uniref:HTH-type transcriptional repressor YtrA n=1 Tax=Thermacetogenium phaeum (strain ATCC BAA-254 / DSM 26808 / PB) TaxID=1089553 RepID=K4LIS1_THEPS|nr:GntR family transcriptional regulator [Thermacetogenium phaeum]AFV12886.1 HTH-type transcriptional repressor YtrA [Thermacetogenium phaeum DSM 12270]
MKELWFDIDQRSSIPIYQQLVDKIKEAVARGILSTGEKLPSVRELAARIAINPNTIAKAYQELEREGVIETLRGRGTFVALWKSRVNEEAKRRVIREMTEKMLVEAFYLGLPREELLEIIEETVREWYRERGGD